MVFLSAQVFVINMTICARLQDIGNAQHSAQMIRKRTEEYRAMTVARKAAYR
jgi:hypothetical protein